MRPVVALGSPGESEATREGPSPVGIHPRLYSRRVALPPPRCPWAPERHATRYSSSLACYSNADWASVSVTSAGALDGPGARSALGLPGRGVTTVITDLGVLTLDEQAGELCLIAVHEGVAVAGVVAATGWPLRVSASVSVEPPPTATELAALRELLAAGPSPA